MKPIPLNEQQQRLVEDNRQLAYWCVSQMVLKKRWRITNIDDWNSEATLALVRAARGYNPEYRQPNGQTVKFSTYAVTAIYRQLHQKRRDDQLQKQRLRESQLLVDADDFDDNHLNAMMTDDVMIDNNDNAELLLHLLRQTTLTDRQIGILYWVFWKQERLTEVGRRFGVTKERIRQIRDAALVLLRQKATELELVA